MGTHRIIGISQEHARANTDIHVYITQDYRYFARTRTNTEISVYKPTGIIGISQEHAQIPLEGMRTLAQWIF